MSESRIQRQRTADLESYRDRLRKGKAEGTSRIALQIFNGGAMPSGGLKTYLGYRTDFDSSDDEGSTYTPTPDTTQQVPVVVLGGTPSVGDILTAHSIGGRWVAERGKGAVTSNCCVTPCGSCKIPSKDLQLAWTDFSGNTGTVTLPFLANHTSAPFDPTPLSPGGLWIAQLVCNTNTIGINLYFGSVSSGFSCTYPFSGPSGSYKLISFTCNPLSLSVQNIFEFGAYTCGGGSSGEPAFGTHTIMTMVVTDPSPVMTPPGLMCQKFIINACNPFGYPGATVTVSSSDGGTVVATGTTGPTGIAWLSWQGTPGTYWISYGGINARFQAPIGKSVVLACSGTTTLTLVPAAGYVCSTGCYLPLKKILNATWTGTCSACPPTVFTWAADANPANTFWLAPPTDPCWPDALITTGLQLGGFPGPASTRTVLDCPPAFEAVYTGVTGSPCTMTVTE